MVFFLLKFAVAFFKGKMNSPGISPSSKSHPLIGGTYHINGVIGKGSFSVVQRVQDIRTKQQYACKVVPISKISAGNRTSTFENEIRIIQQLHHPGVVQLYDLFKDDNYYYLIMELCSRGDLFQYIIQNQRLSELETKYFLKQIFEALQYVHSLGIIHRDLKPENLFFDEFSRIKIGDFGLSRFVNDQGLADTPCGSICYASPECISGSSYDGRKTDVWSVGVIAYAMLTGELPWTKKNQIQLFEQIKNADIIIPSYITKQPRELILKLLEPNPNRRISVEQCLEDPWIKSAPNVRPIVGSATKNLWISLKHIDRFFGRDDPDDQIAMTCKAPELSRSYSLMKDDIENVLKKISSKIEYNTARQAARTILIKPKVKKSQLP